MSEVRIDTTPDGVDDELGDDLRLGLLIATQGAQRIVQMITDTMREREQAQTQETERFRAELEAHRAMATAATRDAGTDKWWQDSSPMQIADAWAVARVWEGQDPELTRRAEAMREGLSDRYGIANPDELGVRDLVKARQDDRAAQVADPLAFAQWQEREYGQFANDLAGQREQLVGLREQAPDGRRQFMGGEDGLAVQDQGAWLDARIGSLEDLERGARLEQEHAAQRGERLLATGAAPATGREWTDAWNTVERREALRTDLTAAGAHPEVVNARLLAERGIGFSPAEAARAGRQAANQAPSQAQRGVRQQQQQARRTRRAR